MEIFKEKARKYFIVGAFSERVGDFDVAAANYFKSLAAAGDYALSKAGLSAKNYEERFGMLKSSFPELYRITSSLFLTYRRAYTKDIAKDEAIALKNKLKEAFRNAGIDVPTDEEVEEHIKKALKR